MTSIVFDAAANANYTATPAVLNHTCTGPNLILVTAFGLRKNQGDVTAVVRNGQSFISIRQDVSAASSQSELWYLINPTVGAFDISATVTGTLWEFGMGSISLTGVDQINPIGAQGGGGQGSGSPVTKNIITSRDNSWVISAFCIQDPRNTTPNSGQDERWDATSRLGGGSIYKHIAGSYDDSWIDPIPAESALSLAEIRPLMQIQKAVM